MDANALGLMPSVEVTYPMQHSALALLPSMIRPASHFYPEHGCQLCWTLDAVTFDDFGKQDAEGQVDVFMRMPHWQEIQSASVKVACAH